MEKTKEIFEKILTESLNGEYINILTPDKAGLFIQYAIELGKEKTNLLKICDGGILSALITTVIAGDLLASLQMPEDIIPAGIGTFMNTYQDDLYFIIGCLTLASERGLNFEGKELEIDKND